jgi:hypothetical protein
VVSSAFSRSHHAVIRVYDEGGNVIETHEHVGEFKDWVEPDGIMLITKSGISKIYFTELPKDVQERFHYDAKKAAEFTSQTTEKIDQLLRQRT